MNKLLALFIKPAETIDEKIQALRTENVILYNKLQDAYRFYCPDHNVGFAKKIGKVQHNRWHHKANES